MPEDTVQTKPSDSIPLSPTETTWLAGHLGKSLFVGSGGSGPIKAPPGVNPAEVLSDEYLNQVRQLRSQLLEIQAQQKGVHGADTKELADLKKKLEELTEPLQKLGMPLETLAEQADKFKEQDDKRQQKLEEMRNLIAIQKEEFNQRTDVVYEVERKQKFLGNKKIPAKVVEGQFVGLKKAKSDSDEYIEMSLEHYKGRVKPLDPEVERLLNLVIEQLELLTKKLLDDEEILLTPNEVMAELWTPLVREGIVSSDQCPEQYSRIMTLWKGSTDLYLKRCEAKARESVDKTENLQNMIEDLDSVLDIGADVAGIVLTFVGGDSAQEILSLVRKCVHGGLQGTQKALAMEFDKAGGCVADILETAVSAATGNKDLAKMVKGAFTASLNGALMSKALANRNWEEAFGFLCDGLEGGFVVMDKGGEGKAGEIGNHVIAGMKGAKGIGKIAYLLTEDPVNTRAVMDEMGGLARDGVTYAVKTYVTAKMKDKEKERIENELAKEDLSVEDRNSLTEELEGLDDKWESTDSDIENLIKTGTSDGAGGGLVNDLAEALGFPEGTEINEEAIMQDVLRRTESKAMEEFAKKEETFERRIAIAFGVGVGADDEQMQMIEDLYDIDVLIGEIEEARAKLQLLKTILDAVSGVLTMLVPQLGGPLKARNFAFDCASAVRRSQELIKFQALVGDARKSTSPQVHVLIAQVDELSHQLTNDIIEAAFHLVEACVTTAAGACELSGIAAPAGEALKIAEMGVEALHKAKKIVYEKFKDNKIKNGWNQFRKAIDNPADRRAIMKAFRKNPTLAKYGMAYGALEMGDAIAKEALRQCGLNDMTLANEKTNAAKVVRYLEVKFPDDIQIVGVLSKFAPDAGDPLSMQVWVKNKELAVEAGWKQESTTEIDVVIIKTKKSNDDIDGLKKTIGMATEDELSTYWGALKENLGELASAFRSYQPKTVAGAPFGRFLQYVNELADTAEQRANELEQEIATRSVSIQREKVGKEKLALAAQEMIQRIAAAQQALTSFLPADDDATGEKAAVTIREYFQTGAGKTLLVEVKAYAKSSVLLTQHIDFFVKAIDLAVMKSEKDPVQVAGHINETVQRLGLCSKQVQATLSA